MSSTDDEDWLYRRGRYADGQPTPAALPAEAPQGAVPPADPAPAYGAPTPVGHYGSPDGETRRTRPGSSGSPQAGTPRQSMAPATRTAPPPRPAATPPVSAPARRPRNRRRILIGVLAVVLAYLIGIPLMTWPFMPRTDATPDGERPADTPGYVFVLAGSDSREGMTDEEKAELGTGNAEGRRTDTIMMLYVPPAGRAALISIPRDSYVAIPGHGRNKINASYAFGGPSLLVETIEQNTGVHVDGFAEVGFGGFANVVDALGGIEMCPEKAIKDPLSNLDIQAGCQNMDGATALGYVRMRKVDPLGDLGRAQRQRAMIAALASKALSPMTLLIPTRWYGLNASLSQGITLGDSVGPLEMMGLVQGGLRIATGRGDTLMVPVSNSNATTAAGSSVLWDDAKAAAMFEAMARGEGDLAAYA